MNANHTHEEELGTEFITAEFKVANRGNLAIQTEIWEVPMVAAKAIVKEFARECGPGSYWGRHLATPMRRAIRNGRKTVTVETAGFSTSELANKLAWVGCRHTHAGDL